MNETKITLNVPYDKFGCKHDETKATLTVYEGEFKENCPAVIVCPGGGYTFLSDREGVYVAEAFAAAGIRPFVLEYSIAPNKFPAALMELAESVRIVKKGSAEYGINPDKVIVCGFSAGGHLAASIGVLWNKPFLAEALGVDKNDIRPAGVILSYPVISSGKYAHVDSCVNLIGDEKIEGEEERIAYMEKQPMYEYISLEKQVDEESVSTFIWTTLKDGLVPMENSMLFVQALRDAGVSVEFHLFPYGDHGLSLATAEVTYNPDGSDIQPYIARWFDMAVEWINIVDKL